MKKKLSLPFIIALSTVILSTVIFIEGCSGKKINNSFEKVNLEEIQGPPVPPAETNISSGVDGMVGPLPGIDYKPPKDGYVLVLAPGLAKSLAYIGILRELEDHQVMVTGIVASEMGALIAAIWASSNANSLEWEMHKFKKSTLLDYPLLGFNKKIADGKKLEGFIHDSVKVDLIEKMKIPLVISYSSKEEVHYEKSGSTVKLIRSSLAIPGVIKPYTSDVGENFSAFLENPLPVQEARNLGLGKILCINVLAATGKKNSSIHNNEAEQNITNLMRTVSVLVNTQMKDCDEVISVPTDGDGFLDFENKADLIYKGKVAIKKWLEKNK